MSKTQTNSQVEIAIQTIETRYAIGQAILKRCGQTSRYGLIAELAEQHEINRDHAQKLRSIVSPKTGYTKRELDKWFRLFREADCALSISHFVKLVSVPKGSVRDRLTQEALSNRWSSKRLQAEILAVQGRRQDGGRKPTVITGEAFEAELERTLWAWDRWLELHLEANSEMRPEIAKELNAIKKKIAKVDGMLPKRVIGP